MPAHIRLRTSTPTQFLLAALLVSFLTIRSSRSQSAQPASLFHEDVLAELTPGAEVKQTLVGDHHLAWIEKLGDKRSVHLDGNSSVPPTMTSSIFSSAATSLE